MAQANESPNDHTDFKGRGWPYLIAVFAVLAAVLGGFVAVFVGSYADRGLDHVTAISPERRPEWFQDLDGLRVSEIQDQDLFYHDIGSSIDNARKADIVILGSSLASFGFDSPTLETELERRYGLRVFNMAFVGVASGEFAKQVVKRYDIRPRLWIINADDGGGGGNFFSRDLVRAFSADVRTISATEHGWLRAVVEVVRRNMRWRLEKMAADLPTGSLIERQSLIPSFYRNSRTGATDMSAFPRYLADGNPGVRITRAPDCHTTPQVVAIARDYVREIGGKVVLTLIPNLYACSHQAREVADALGIEFVLPARDDYSSWDNGGHLDRRGAAQMTADFIRALEKTATFKAAFLHQ